MTKKTIPRKHITAREKAMKEDMARMEAVFSTDLAFKLDVYHKVRMNFELFGKCEGFKCYKERGALCESCAAMMHNHQVFFCQTARSVVMFRPQVFRTYFMAEPLALPYMSIYSGLHLLDVRIHQVCNPDNKTLYDFDPRWEEWLIRMDSARKVAYPLLLRNDPEFMHERTVANLSRDRLTILRVMETQIGYGECVMEEVNSMDRRVLDDLVQQPKLLYAVKMDEIHARIHARLEKWKPHYLCQFVIETTFPLCPAERVELSRISEESYNVKHDQVMMLAKMQELKMRQSLVDEAGYKPEDSLSFESLLEVYKVWYAKMNAAPSAIEDKPSQGTVEELILNEAGEVVDVKASIPAIEEVVFPPMIRRCETASSSISTVVESKPALRIVGDMIISEQEEFELATLVEAEDAAPSASIPEIGEVEEEKKSSPE